MENQELKVHPFERTLGPGPYRIVGYFYINIAAGQQGRPYYDESQVHPRFVTGAGTCAHCGHAILNVYQVQVGNGDVYGVGSDCIMKVGLPVKEMTRLEKMQREHEKAKRQERKARKGDEARTELREMIAAQADLLKSKPHPTFPQKTLLDYAQFILDKSSDGGVVFALKRVKFLLTQ